MQKRFYENILFRGVIENNISKVETSLKHEIDVNVRINNNKSPLYLAIKNNNSKIAYLLIKNKTINLHSLCYDKELKSNLSYLHLACLLKNSLIVELLIKSNKLNERYLNRLCLYNSIKVTPLHLSIAVSEVSIIDLLLKTNLINLNITDSLGRSVLFYATQNMSKFTESNKYIMLQLADYIIFHQPGTFKGLYYNKCLKFLNVIFPFDISHMILKYIEMEVIYDFQSIRDLIRKTTRMHFKISKYTSWDKEKANILNKSLKKIYNKNLNKYLDNRNSFKFENKRNL